MKRCFVKKERNRIENPKMDKETRFVHFILLGVYYEYYARLAIHELFAEIGK